MPKKVTIKKQKKQEPLQKQHQNVKIIVNPESKKRAPRKSRAKPQSRQQAQYPIQTPNFVPMYITNQPQTQQTQPQIISRPTIPSPIVTPSSMLASPLPAGFSVPNSFFIPTERPNYPKINIKEKIKQFEQEKPPTKASSWSSIPTQRSFGDVKKILEAKLNFMQPSQQTEQPTSRSKPSINWNARRQYSEDELNDNNSEIIPSPDMPNEFSNYIENTMLGMQTEDERGYNQWNEILKRGGYEQNPEWTPWL